MRITYRQMSESGQYGERQYTSRNAEGAEDVRSWLEEEFGAGAAETLREVPWSGSQYGFRHDGTDYGVQLV